ncbi:MAG: hypothetical protein A3J59_04265 [Candidatus Buchananbacteria bacterium RIFCSPHIGHO2_02_FULL_56_16]|uniref:Uncharacterized protein n=1 Tax=Candidatus Buchananbacteria bacterium RIFCSPHIGHO2_02_FULL_56_16 TaxID=1797542 RepID=A0A1G1YJS6_9BACT|nr:MAG: hypothetical protein A3J59_04265 [Candidatus Buchananbacteria bacterium RIFCSPHIGHO2_02_FULL_56_16]
MGTQLETQEVHRSQLIPLRDYAAAQLEEIDSPLNEWGAGQEFGHQPDRLERLLHYINCSREKQFCVAHSDENIWYASQALGCNVTALSPVLRERVLIAFYDFWQEAKTSWQQQHGAPFPFQDFIPS